MQTKNIDNANKKISQRKQKILTTQTKNIDNANKKY
jgi:hypothetical protein